MSKITETIRMEGMNCAGSCVRRVTKALENVAGIEVEEVGVGSARVSYNPGRVEQAAITRAIEGAGFRPVLTPA